MLFTHSAHRLSKLYDLYKLKAKRKIPPNLLLTADATFDQPADDNLYNGEYSLFQDIYFLNNSGGKCLFYLFSMYRYNNVMGLVDSE